MSELSSLLGGNKTFSAFFEQVVYSPRGRIIQESHGRIWVERPGRFRWEATQPFPQTVVSDGEQLWFYDPDLEQVSIRPFDNRLASTPGLLLSGETDQLDSSFVVERGDAHPPIKGLVNYVLTPRNPESLFSVLELTFKDSQLVAMRIRDSLGQLTDFRFSDVAVNMAIDSNQFLFVVPEGVDVIRQ
ncbi:MAG: outer membrane lipoprotein chaperone LolA [Pseudomonadales bacterium]|nr:outer membrane lipoprotein chaperone LolA [Pseudomonadales bacterium]